MQRMPQLMNCTALATNTLTAEQTLLNTVYTQCVRWKRKPIWLPTAKSKVFKVPVKPTAQPGEAPEMLRLYNRYRTVMKSINGFLLDAGRKEHKLLEFEAVQLLEQKDFDQCFKINQIWNAKLAEEREKRLEIEREQKAAQIAKKLEMKQQRDMMLQERADEEIRIMKKESSRFITAENIDEAIERALDNIIEHNFALDVTGQFLKEEEIQNAALPYYNRDKLRFVPRKEYEPVQKHYNASDIAP